MHRNIREIDQYSSDQFGIEAVYRGAQSEAILLFLKPGQETSSHSHDRLEIVFVRQKGKGVLTIDDDKEVLLAPETVHYEPMGSTVRIKNTGDDVLQILVVLIHVESAAITAARSPEQSPSIGVNTGGGKIMQCSTQPLLPS